MSRSLLGLPAGGITLHLIGDVHAGTCPQYRYDAIISDLKRNPGLLPALHIQMGDNVDGFNAVASEDNMFSTLMARLPAPWKSLIGNHDILQQTVAQWEAKWGPRNYVFDFPTLRLIACGGDDADGCQSLSASTLAFLSASLASTANPCFLITHFPPYNSVGGLSANEFNSTTASFICNPPTSAAVNAVIAAHSNFKAWISAHTHSRVTAPGLVTPMVAGSVRYAAVNCSSPFYSGNDHTAPSKLGGPLDAINTLFLTWYDTGTIEVRIRDHGASQWMAPNGSPVLSVTGL